jgi:hypothetical protein
MAVSVAPLIKSNRRAAGWGRPAGNSSPSWLATLRFTSVEEHPARPAGATRRSVQGGLAGMFFDEVKRTEGSHEEKNRPRSPPIQNKYPA